MTDTTTRVRMLSTTNGAPDPGTHTYTYHAEDEAAGHSGVYDVTPRLAQVFVEWGYAVLVEDEAGEADVPDGQVIPETEDERREREAATAAGEEPTPPSRFALADLDPDHYPAQAAAILQAKAERDQAAQNAPAPEADAPVDLSQLNRKQLDAAAKQIGLDTLNLPNKDAVRQAIAEAQGAD